MPGSVSPDAFLLPKPRLAQMATELRNGPTCTGHSESKSVSRGPVSIIGETLLMNASSSREAAVWPAGRSSPRALSQNRVLGMAMALPLWPPEPLLSLFRPRFQSPLRLFTLRHVMASNPGLLIRQWPCPVTAGFQIDDARSPFFSFQVTTAFLFRQWTGSGPAAISPVQAGGLAHPRWSWDLQSAPKDPLAFRSAQVPVPQNNTHDQTAGWESVRHQTTCRFK
jgi:hypothetical protein